MKIETLAAESLGAEVPPCRLLIRYLIPSSHLPAATPYLMIRASSGGNDYFQLRFGSWTAQTHLRLPHAPACLLNAG